MEAEWRMVVMRCEEWEHGFGEILVKGYKISQRRDKFK
jgi:hypothetical protein